MLYNIIRYIEVKNAEMKIVKYRQACYPSADGAFHSSFLTFNFYCTG